MLSGLLPPRNARKLLMLPLVVLLTVWIGSQSIPKALWRLQHAPQQVKLHSTASGAVPEQTVRPQPRAQRQHSVSDADPGLPTIQQPAVAAARASQVVTTTIQRPAVVATRASQVITSSQQPAVAAARTSQVITSSQQPAVAAARASQVVTTTIQQPAVAAARASQVVTTTIQRPAVVAARASQVITTTSQQPEVAATRTSQVVATTIQQPAVAATRTSQVIATTIQRPAVAATRTSQVIRLPPGQQPATPLPRNGTRTILYGNKFYGHADFYVGYGRKPFLGCAQDNCVTTSNRSHLAEADAVLFHMLDPVLPLPPRRPHQRFVFFLKEPPTLSAIRQPRYRGVFNLTMTYRRDSEVVADYFSVEHGAEPTPLPAVELRSKAVAWIVSHCETTSGRELYVDELQRFIDVDVYGKCGTLPCPTPAHGGTDRYECHRMVAEHYHFYLAFENSQCRDYVTEKLSLPLRYGMVPVVLGDNRALYERLAPPGSFIHIADFAGPQQLADHLRYLMTNRTAFLEYFDWRQRYRVGGATTWCSLCRYLHEPHAPQYYDDISSWWVDEGACSLETVVPEPDTAEGEDAGPPERAT